MPPEASFPGCVPGGGAGVLLPLVVLLETSSGQRWVAGQAAGMKTPENFQDAGGVLGFICSWGSRAPAQMQLFLAPYCHGNPCAPPSQLR